LRQGESAMQMIGVIFGWINDKMLKMQWLSDIVKWLAVQAAMGRVPSSEQIRMFI
jgi:hypothetical protein